MKSSTTTKHGKRYGRGPHARPKGWKPPAREDHAPVTGERFGQRRRRMDQRTVANKAGGCVSTIERPICANLAPKNVEKLNHYQIFPPTTQTTASPPLEPLLSDFLPNKQRKLKKYKERKKPP